MIDEQPKPKQPTATDMAAEQPRPKPATVTEMTDEQPKPVVSRPEPVARGAPAPETTEGQDWEEGTWAGLRQWTCKLKVQHPAANDTSYDLPCNRTYFSHEELMEHFRDDNH